MKFFIIFVAFTFSIGCVLAETDGGAACNPNNNDKDHDDRNPACDNHGYCSETTNTCVCEDAYADYDCSYARKSRLLAFILQFFFGGFGAGYFVLGHALLGGMLLMLTLCGSITSICIVGIQHTFHIHKP